MAQSIQAMRQLVGMGDPGVCAGSMSMLNPSRLGKVRTRPPVVKYEYEVVGQKYHSTCVYFSDNYGAAFEGFPRRLVKKYPVESHGSSIL